MSTELSGHVVDKDRRPVANVKITSNGRTIGTTGGDGSFAVKLRDAARRVAVTFGARGYVANTRIFDGRGSRGNLIVIWPTASRVGFDPGRGLDVELGSSRIQVPADALVSSGGKKADGRAELRFTLFDVTDPFQRAAAAGDFASRSTDGTTERLSSFGIFDLDVTDASGRRLGLRRDASVELAVAVPPRLARRAPKEVGFYDFDPLSGFWVPAGTFGFVPAGLTYNGSVVPFGGLHNLDETQSVTCVTVQVVSIWDGSGMGGFQVTAHGPQYDSYGTTDGNGFVCLLVDTGATFTVTAFGTVGATFWSSPQPPTFTAPNFSSTAEDCGDSVKCPLLGTVAVDFVVGGIAVLDAARVVPRAAT